MVARTQEGIHIETYAARGILVLAVLMYCIGVGAHDLLSDDALNSFRALGWFDYLGGTVQTTPIQWFDTIPWWANLSFHDAPPLAFGIQYLFFGVFGMSAFAAKLPFALAGLGVVFVLYRIFLEWRGRAAALAAALLATVSSYAVWASQAGYLEGIEVLFLSLAGYFFLRYTASGAWRDAVWLGVAAGCALSVKYTAIFLVPAVFLYALVWRRDIFLRGSFWAAALIALAVLAPVLIYNAEVYATRGHFDAAASSMAGMHPDDFKLIASRGVSTDFSANAAAIGKTLYIVTSIPFLALYAVSVLFLGMKVIRKKGDALERFLLLAIILVFVMFLFIGAAERFLSVMVPFLVAAFVVFAYDLFLSVKTKAPRVALGVVGALLVVAGFELFYNVNTNILAQPAVAHAAFSSPARLSSVGFNELHDYIGKNIFPELAEFRRPHDAATMHMVDEAALRGGNILLFDETIYWFAYVWYIQPYSVYYRLPVISFTNYLQAIPKDSDPLRALAGTGAKGMYYVAGVSDRVVDPVKKRNDAMRSLEISFAEYLDTNGYFIDTIYDRSGSVAFKVYYIPLNGERR